MRRLEADRHPCNTSVDHDDDSWDVVVGVSDCTSGDPGSKPSTGGRDKQSLSSSKSDDVNPISRGSRQGLL